MTVCLSIPCTPSRRWPPWAIYGLYVVPRNHQEQASALATVAVFVGEWQECSFSRRLVRSQHTGCRLWRVVAVGG